MKAFTGIPAFLTHLAGMAAETENAHRAGLKKAADIIRDDAKASLGTDINGWPELAQSTQMERARQGYSPNEPLLRSKTLQGAIESELVSSSRALIGVPSDTGEVEPEGALVGDVAADMEFGTMRSPPRPFMAPAAARKGKEAADAVAGELWFRLKGG